MLVRYANSASNIKLAKRLVKLYAVILTPIVALGFMLLAISACFLPFQLTHAIMPTPDFAFMMFWIFVSLYCAVFFVIAAVSEKSKLGDSRCDSFEV
jgi:hypothetical protein